MRDFAEQSSRWQVCPAEQPSRSSNASREVLRQYPAMLLHTKYLFLDKASIFHGRVLLFVLAHSGVLHGRFRSNPSASPVLGT